MPVKDEPSPLFPMEEHLIQLRDKFPSNALFKTKYRSFEHADVHKYQDGLVFKGDFEDGRMQGPGLLHYEEPGHIVKGWLDKGMLKGLGTMKHPSGDSFSGMIKENNAEGYGIYTYANGTVLFGGFQSNKLNGLGYEKQPNGTEYFGFFKNNKKDGMGLAILGASKDVVFAEYKKDKLSGYGFYESSLFLYEGHFKNNGFNGEGVLRRVTGETMIGNFRDNQIYGIGTILFPGGLIYHGAIDDNTMHGAGKLYYPGEEHHCLEVSSLNGRIVRKSPLTEAQPCVTYPARPQDFSTIVPFSLIPTASKWILENGGELKKLIKKSKKWKKKYGKECK